MTAHSVTRDSYWLAASSGYPTHVVLISVVEEYTVTTLQIVVLSLITKPFFKTTTTFLVTISVKFTLSLFMSFLDVHERSKV